MRTVVHVSDLHFGRVDPALGVEGPAFRTLLDLLRDEPDLPQRLHEHIALFSQEMSARLPHLPMSGSQIVPLIVGAFEDGKGVAALRGDLVLLAAVALLPLTGVRVHCSADSTELPCSVCSPCSAC